MQTKSRICALTEHIALSSKKPLCRWDAGTELLGSSRDYDILSLEDGRRLKQNLALMDLQNLNIPSA